MALLQPFTLQIAEYEVVVVGLTPMAAPVWPVDHSTTPVQFFTSSVTGSPGHTFVATEVTSGFSGPGVTVMVTLAGELAQVPILQVAV